MASSYFIILKLILFSVCQKVLFFGSVDGGRPHPENIWVNSGKLFFCSQARNVKATIEVMQMNEKTIFNTDPTRFYKGLTFLKLALNWLRW